MEALAAGCGSLRELDGDLQDQILLWKPPCWRSSLLPVAGAPGPLCLQLLVNNAPFYAWNKRGRLNRPHMFPFWELGAEVGR